MVKLGREAKDKFRILSLDGGGIYGMFTDLMLKDIKERNASFLDGGDVNLFAGTSAGAVNSLLLAMHDKPADGLDTAIKFWAEPGLYANSDPFKLLFSIQGLSPYFGTEDYKRVLQNYFGERTLGDLKHPVLVVTWDWAGRETPPGRPRHWRPKIYCNFPDDNPDRRERLGEVPFMAGAPSWFRCIYDGRQDGGWIAPNPALYAITKTINAVSEARKAPRWDLPEAFRLFREDEPGKATHHGLREHLSVFSLGVGAQQPFLPISYSNWGQSAWMTGMWNPYMQQWVWPMVSIALDGPTEAVDTQCALLLNNIPGKPDGFLRLNPQVLETPVMDVLMQLRANPFYLEYIKNTIHSAVGKPAAQKALRHAELWLAEAGWFGGVKP